MGILLAVKAEKMRLSNLAERMNFTATEASRQLQRLGEARLIQRDSEGFFSATKYGELCLQLLDNLISPHQIEITSSCMMPQSYRVNSLAGWVICVSVPFRVTLFRLLHTMRRC